MAYTEDLGEVEGAFELHGTLIDLWSCNDASWRGEYFDGMMHTLGIDVKYPYQLSEEKETFFTKRLMEEANKLWNYDDDEDDEDE